MKITPNEPIGTRTPSMVVVLCPKCGKKRWANITRDRKSARTTCCGEITTIKSEVTT